jgi:hypothetical protein
MSTIFISVASTACQLLTQAGSSAKLEPDQVVVHHVLGQHRQRGRGEVEQEDEEQRPEHRLARVTHRGGGVVAHQDVRQGSGADHQAQHQGQEVVALVAGCLSSTALALAISSGVAAGFSFISFFSAPLPEKAWRGRPAGGLGAGFGGLPLGLELGDVGREVRRILFRAVDGLGVGRGGCFRSASFCSTLAFCSAWKAAPLPALDRFVVRAFSLSPHSAKWICAHGSFGAPRWWSGRSAPSPWR